MTLVKSISGIRGTIGGVCGEGLTPVDTVNFTYAYCHCMKLRKKPSSPDGRYRVVVGRDARISGEMIENLVVGTITGCGVDVIRCGLSSTPTTEMAVILSKADGGIIITASHNPRHWNALKLLDERGEFLTAEQGKQVLDCAEKEEFNFAGIDEIGKIFDHDFTDEHLDAVLALEAVDRQAIREAGFKAVLDSVNSVGGIIVPKLLERLGVECLTINGKPDGEFAHNPEPLPQNLSELCAAVVENGADVGISVDPDVDRLALICEDGEPFVEENTLIAVADYLIERERKAGNNAPIYTVSNLSSSRGLRDITEKHGGTYLAAAVGEVNVTTKMHQVGALIGGEGNGGVIYPAIHCGRDAMVGIALLLSSLAQKKMKMSQLKESLPHYCIVKNKIGLSDPAKTEEVLEKVKKHYANEKISTIDGVKIDFDSSHSWVHLRRSNTEPIMRVYSEAPDSTTARKLAEEVMAFFN